MARSSRGPARVRVALVSALAGATLLALPAPAQADHQGWPPGWPADPDLSAPGLEALRYGFNPDPWYPRSFEELKQSPEPACPAPDLPEPTGAGSPDGYTVPVRIKITNGVLLAGYTDRAYFRHQAVPFAIQASGMTGWVTARVSLPSLRVRVDPADVRLCETRREGGGRRGPIVGGTVVKAFQAALIQVIPGQLDNYRAGLPTQTAPFPGTTTVGWPGSLGVRVAGLDNMGMEDLIARRVEIGVSGLAADGSLELATGMEAGMVTAPEAYADGSPNVSFTCDVQVRGTFGTAAKGIVAPEPPTLPTASGGVYRPQVPERQDRVWLPTKALTGAVEGGTATIGSNRFDIQAPINGLGANCGRRVNAQFYGYGLQRPDLARDNANASVAGGTIIPDDGFPIMPGLSDLSLDLTVDEVGLPKRDDLDLADYGFE